MVNEAVYGRQYPCILCRMPINWSLIEKEKDKELTSGVKGNKGWFEVV